MDESKIYTLGGTVSPHQLYLARKADEELLQSCRQGEPVYVFAPRQMGKSSLAVHIIRQLSEMKVRAAFIDLSMLNSDLPYERWYRDLAFAVAHRLDIESDFAKWWEGEDGGSEIQKLGLFFEEFLLTKVKEQVVVFIDEFEAASKPDDFLSLIRSFYNMRGASRTLGRISFVLFGVTPPGQLQRDSKTSPFINTARVIELTGFTYEEALPLAEGFGLSAQHARQVLEWVLEWTDGHPYLTQRLCSAIAENFQSSWSETDVEKVVTETFFGDKALQDSNLMYISRLLTSFAHAETVLSVYQNILKRTLSELTRPSADEKQALDMLLSSGVVVHKGRGIQVRNRIYREVFNDKWVADQLITARLNPLERLDLGTAERAVASSLLRFLVTSSGVRVACTSDDLSGFTQLPPEKIDPVLARLAEFRVLRPVTDTRGGVSVTRYEVASDNLAFDVLEWLADGEQAQDEAELETATEASGVIDEHSSLTSVRVYVGGVYPEFRQEREAVKSVLSSLREKLFAGLEYFVSRQNKEELSLWELERSSIYICIVGESYGSGLTEREYQRAGELKIPRFIYLKGPGKLSATYEQSANQQSRFRELVLAENTVRYFNTAHELSDMVSTDLTTWLGGQALPALLKSAARPEVPADVRRLLLFRIKNSSAIDPSLMDLLRARVSEVETKTGYWFYLSYARADLDDYLRQFYWDLSRTVANLTGGDWPAIGFFDNDDIQPDARWFTTIADALQKSRVFVSLYTPAYFQSEYCGKEWQVFESRLDEAASATTPDASRPPLILPVLWSVPKSLRPLPEAAANIQYSHPEYGGAYLEVGLRELMMRAGHQDSREYENFVLSFAERLVAVARTYEIPALPETPALESVRNAFRQADAPEPGAPETQRVPERRYVLVAGTGSYELPENVRKVSTELGKALARNGYGLVVGGWAGVDYVVSVAFANELEATDRLLSDYLIQVIPAGTKPPFTGGRIIHVQEGEAEYSDEIKQVDAVVLIGGLGGTYEVYKHARRAQKPVFPVADTGSDALTAFQEIIADWETEPPQGINVERFHELGKSLESDLDVQKAIEVLLELLDGLWAKRSRAMSYDEALARVVFVKGNLLDQPVDALVNAVGTNPQNAGIVGEELFKIFGPEFYDRADFQKPLKAGETLVSKVGARLAASYIIHTCSETTPGVHTVASLAQAVAGALAEADRLDVRTVAFPSIGTGAAGLEVSNVAPAVLEAVVNYLRLGSGLEKVVFAFTNNSYYRAHLSAYRKMGGGGLNVLLPRLSVSSRRALGFAEAVRQHLGGSRVNTRLLLLGLYQKLNGAARTLLTAISSAEEIDKALLSWIGVESLPTDIEPIPDSALAHINLSNHCQQAIMQALELAGDSEVARERQLLAGLLGIPGCRATRWIEEISGISAATLWDIVAVRNEDEGQAIAARVGSLLARQGQVRTYLWRLKLSEPQADGQAPADLRVGEKQTYRLDLVPAMSTDDEEDRRRMLRIPVNTLEVTGYIKAHGFHLHGDSIFTIPVTDGRPANRSVTFDLTPLVSGPRTVQVEVYPGGRIQGLLPSIASLKLRVAAPIALPDIKELIDRRRIPDPQPDVMLYVALEEIPDGQRTRIYLTCPMLNLDREPLEPLMLGERDLAELRGMAIQTAVGAAHLSPQDVLAAMRGFGAMLFDKIIPASLQGYYSNISQLAAASPTPWSWLIISDESASLPWELVCYYGVEPGTGRIRYDDFLADKFLVAHWVGQRGLRLIGEAPVGKLDLIHYAQRPGELPQWLAALGGEEYAQAEEESGHISLLQSGSYFYGLHLLRYAEQRRSDRIVPASIKAEPRPESARNEGEDITYEQRLDLTLRRPTVGLSFVNSSPPGRVSALGQCDTRLESSWMIPLMHAGASALTGTRWPVSQEVDISFIRQFYQAVRGGESLGAAVWLARQQVRAAFPHRPDWLAYTYFGHPQCEPYQVLPAKGFTLFEAIDQPDDVPFLAGSTYRFRASYRAEAPAWYNGRLRAQSGPLHSDDISVVVMPLSGVMPETIALQPVPQSDDLQCVVTLTMPEKKNTLPVIVRFQRGSEELRTITLNLQVEGGPAR